MTARHVFSLITVFCCIFNGMAQENLSIVNAYRDSAKHYEALNKNQQAYNFTTKVKALLVRNANTAPDKLARTESDLGTYAYRMGNISLSQVHHREALRIARSLTPPNYECLYLSGNNMGSIMWFASKMDSALYYFQMAIDAVAHMDTTPQNKYYRPAVLYNNLAGIYGVQGKAVEGIAAMKKTIYYLQVFLAIKDTSLPKGNALHFQFEATDNLAGIYKELGDYRRAENLLTYSYQQKQKTLGQKDADVYKSEVLLGQLYYAMKEFASGEQFLLRGIKNFDNADGDYLFWKADAYSALAMIAEDTHKPSLAKTYYERADSLYEASLGGEYDNIYLQFLRDAAVFYAQNKMPSIAMQKVQKGYKYIAATEGKRTLSGFHQLLNLAEVNFELGNFSQTAQNSQEALTILRGLMNDRKDVLDSVKMELKEPRAILLLSRARYGMLDKKTPEDLQAILAELRKALYIVQRHRSILQDLSDINLLIADNQELIDFMKTITAELHALTGNAAYMEELISLHESGMYNRIRARLNQDADLRFYGIPSAVMEQETILKRNLNVAADAPEAHGEKMKRYLKAEEEWNGFLQMLRQQYPQYYNMRYASLLVSLQQVSAHIPKGTTIVRYMFAGKSLLALVADKNTRNLVHLNATGLNDEIDSLSHGANTGLLHRLYQRLWHPLASYIRYKRVTIIPDGVLFNINFEVLTPVAIHRFDELATNSILSKYTVSYNYSLLLLDSRRTANLSDNFVAFTPGFFNDNKILPQPFTVDLGKRVANRFDGSVFAGQQSTVSAFRKNANGHKIIHIGTHAEADNLHPQYSRLIFSPDGGADTAENSLYLFDIYNCDLHANLAVIAACESGKVGYQDGEGLLSLAHAFNYAGSESMLTGLWKIDEKSAADIMQSFYENLSNGMSKDDALREAKLRYLATSNGRALNPQYWAGLIIMGSTSPIVFTKSSNGVWWIAGLAIVLGVLAFIAIKVRS